MAGIYSSAWIHPSAVLFGTPKQIAIGRGTKIGERVRIDPGTNGLVKIGESVWISTDVEVQTDRSVIVGDRTTVQRRCTLIGHTRIGRDCILAPGVFISSGTHPFRFISYLPIREQERRLAEQQHIEILFDKSVWIQDDCWLGINVVISPGVTVGKGSVIGANSVVTKNVAPYSIMGGVPARDIGKRLDWAPPLSINPDREEDYPYILDAVLKRENGVKHIEITNRNAALLVLATPTNGSHRLSMEYTTNTPVTLLINGHEVMLTKGRGVSQLSAVEVTKNESFMYCNIAVSNDTVNNVIVKIFQLSILFSSVRLKSE